ncbi:MAG: hypothetical protein LBJ59_05065 [Zoogloeaceae bacterium]|jgi:hypothetical protein|nr:hypothetical protein [Zoogloeaceae bacterium]
MNTAKGYENQGQGHSDYALLSMKKRQGQISSGKWGRVPKLPMAKIGLRRVDGQERPTQAGKLYAQRQAKTLSVA